MPIRRLVESTFSRFLPMRESKKLPVLKKGLGTPVAEYNEVGENHCGDCIYITARKGNLGLCNEVHVMKDPKMKTGKKGQKIVNLVVGCCRFMFHKKLLKRG